jgi:glycine cleavage system H protein
MAIINGCEIPEDLFYDVGREVWLRFGPDGTVTLGMTDSAQARVGKLVNIRIKAVGKTVRKGGSAGTIESAKWVGPFPAPLSGEIVETNEATFRRDILAANKDPYGRGWILRMRPTALDEERGDLVTGTAAVEAYRKRIAELNLTCVRCAG